jgi:hypothetical protein
MALLGGQILHWPETTTNQASKATMKVNTAQSVGVQNGADTMQCCWVQLLVGTVGASHKMLEKRNNPQIK